MLIRYPEAQKVKKGDVEAFLAVLGLAQYKGSVVTKELKVYREKLDEVAWLDPRTGLIWAKEDNGKSITREDAKSYCENYSIDGLTGWRMPTKPELESLTIGLAYQNIKRTGKAVWSSTDTSLFFFSRSDAAFTWCFEKNGCPDESYYARALPVYPGK